MNHYSHLKVAEISSSSEQWLGSDRCGHGEGYRRSGARPRTAAEPAQPGRADHRQQVPETLAWLYEAFPDDHAFTGHPLMTTVPAVPQTGLLGSSPNGSNLAAGLAIGYTFAGFMPTTTRPGA